MVQLHPDFSGGKVFITDGASGIGFAIGTSVCWLVLRLLLLISKKRPAAQRELESMGSAVRFLPMDVSSPASVVATLAAAIDELGVIDYAINNSGIAFTGSTVAETEFEQWRRVRV
jgi:3-oxoacyl-[acyl-carrier protein] reductase